MTPTTTAMPTQPTATGQSLTQGEQLRRSPAVQNAISAIAAEVKARQLKINDVRGPLSPSAAQSYQQFLESVSEARGRALLYPYIGSGLGNGPWVELADGSVKLDMITGIGVQFFGHSDPEMVQTALEAATGDVVMQGHLQANEDAFRFGETLLEHAKRCSRLAHVFLCNSGVMANENALKVCFQKHAPASRVIAFADCFMGRSWSMAQIGDAAANRQGLPLNVLVDYVPFFNAAQAKQSGGDRSGTTRVIDASVKRLREVVERYPQQNACFIFELVQGEGGFNTAPPAFFKELMTVCREAGIAIWVDEVQTFGRTPSMFAFEALGLGDFVDVSCVGKMTQICAALYSADYNPKAGLLGATFLGSTEAVRVGRRVIERLRDGDYYGPRGRIARHHEAFVKQVRALAAKHPQWFPASPNIDDIAGGSGGMMRFTPFGGKKDDITKLCRVLFDKGLIVFYCGHGPYHVRMLPPLGVLEESIWPKVFSLIEAGMSDCAASS